MSTLSSSRRSSNSPRAALTPSVLLHIRTGGIYESSRTRQIVLLGEVHAPGMSPGLSIDWRSYDGNSPRKARLNASLWNGHPPFPGLMTFEEPKKLNEMEFVFDIRQDEQYCWKTISKNPRHFPH